MSKPQHKWLSDPNYRHHKLDGNVQHVTYCYVGIEEEGWEPVYSARQQLSVLVPLGLRLRNRDWRLFLEVLHGRRVLVEWSSYGSNKSAVGYRVERSYGYAPENNPNILVFSPFIWQEYLRLVAERDHTYFEEIPAVAELLDREMIQPRNAVIDLLMHYRVPSLADYHAQHPEIPVITLQGIKAGTLQKIPNHVAYRLGKTMGRHPAIIQREYTSWREEQGLVGEEELRPDHFGQHLDGWQARRHLFQDGLTVLGYSHLQVDERGHITRRDEPSPFEVLGDPTQHWQEEVDSYMEEGEQPIGQQTEMRVLTEIDADVEEWEE